MNPCEIIRKVPPVKGFLGGMRSGRFRAVDTRRLTLIQVEGSRMQAGLGGSWWELGSAPASGSVSRGVEEVAHVPVVAALASGDARPPARSVAERFDLCRR